MHRKERQSGQHITFFYIVSIVSSSSTATHSRHHLPNINFTILLVSTMGWTISCTTFNSSHNIALFVVARNPLHITMASSVEYTIQKNHIDPLGNIGKACIGSHFAYPKSSHLLSSHTNSSHFGTYARPQYYYTLLLTFAKEIKEY
ncbi:hypothetical protein ACJW30_07G036600 [Castanea mollissima]